jgi:hypothetical protein
VISSTRCAPFKRNPQCMTTLLVSDCGGTVPQLWEFAWDEPLASERLADQCVLGSRRSNVKQRAAVTILRTDSVILGNAVRIVASPRSLFFDTPRGPVITVVDHDHHVSAEFPAAYARLFEELRRPVSFTSLQSLGECVGLGALACFRIVVALIHHGTLSPAGPSMNDTQLSQRRLFSIVHPGLSTFAPNRRDAAGLCWNRWSGHHCALSEAARQIVEACHDNPATLVPQRLMDDLIAHDVLACTWHDGILPESGAL